MNHLALSLPLGLILGAAGVVGSSPTAIWPTAIPLAGVETGTASAAVVQAPRDAIAATVIQAMRSRFDGVDVEFKFDKFHSEQGSLRDVALSGAGQVRLAGGSTWMPIRYSALFDTRTGEILGPQVEFDTHSARAAATGVDAASLDAVVDGQLAEEFASQSTQFQLGDLKLVSGDARYVLVAGTGEAEFEGEGSAEVAVQAVYDRRAQAWLDVRYTLG